MRPVRPTPGNQLVIDRLAPRAPRGESLVVAPAPHLVLHPVERLEGRQRQGRSRVTSVQCFQEITPRMHVTAALNQLRPLETLVEEAGGVRHRVAPRAE